MMPNHPANEDLFAYRDGELEMEKRSLIEAHVLSCTACQTRLDETSDAEGMLRQQLHDPSDAYFDELTGSVMARVVGEVPSAAPRAPAAPVRDGDRGRDPKGALAVEAPRDRAGRRRSLDDSPRGRAPGLPWPAILSAASAAAAVLVVVAILVQRQDVWRHAPAPGVVGLPGEAGSPATDRDGRQDKATTRSEELAKEQEPDAGNGPDANKGDLLANGAPPPAIPQPAVPPPALTAKDEPMAASRQEEIKTQSASEALPEAALQKAAADPAARVAALRARADAAAPIATSTGEPSFGEVATRYGLPLLYDPARVRGGALLRAEPELRLLYQSGRAGDDSARVRLYLAEAAREHAQGSFDAETFDAIVHHYRRAVELARDGETARMARKRLEDFVSRNAPRE